MNPPIRTLFATLSLWLPAAAQTTWHVDASGAPPGSGTPGEPYTSIQYALGQPATVAGDTILVAPGIYVEALLVQKAVTVRSSGGPLVTEIRSPGPNHTMIFMDGNADPDLVGFTLAGPAKTLIYQDGGRVIDCILDGRGATHTGFDMFLGSMVGCTVFDCAIGVRGDSHFDSALEMHGCVVWDNGKDIFDATLILKKVEYSAGLDSDPKWLAFGPGNVIGNPKLWAVGFGDVNLGPGSPCIDAGDPSAPLDPDGSRDDIGALPYDPAYIHGPVVYCTAKPSSGGCTPSISASGTSSASQPVQFQLQAAGILENTVGILLTSKAGGAIPFQGGFLCISGTVTRTGFQASGAGGAPCSGGFQFEFNAHVQSGIDPTLQPGTLVFAQYWFRDLQDPAGFGSGLSNAVRFGVGP
jgi:hypothetical protein